MTRVSTAGNYSAILANIQNAQSRQYEAGNQVSSQKKANDYKGYARNAEVLTAMRGVQAKVDGFIDQNKMLTAKLDMQGTGLAQVSDAAKGAREAIADALASDNADTLMQSLQGFLTDAAAGLNQRHGGRYLFSGGQVDTKPVTAAVLSDLTAAPTTDDLFHNDDFKTVNRLDDATSVQTGFLASDVGKGLFEQLRQIQDFVETNGPFTGNLTDAQKSFLTDTVPQFETLYNNLTAVEAQNGIIQNQVDTARTNLNDRQDMLEGMTGDITDVDLTEAISNLQSAQVSVQAAAQVFASLRATSLLDILQ